MIVLDSVGKAFDGEFAVRDLSVTVAAGEVFGLVGPNGAGKTTTLRMMTGLLSPDLGKVLIGGFDVTAEPMQAKALYGYVPDKPFLYEKLTVREFLVFTASVHRVEKQIAAERIDALLPLFSLAETEHELIEGLSQGMRQRLVFSAALIHDPAVLFIDEPFVGLDPFGVRMLKGLIRDLASRQKSIFLATHSLHIAEEVCDRVGFIRKGMLLAVKSREELAGMEGGLEALFMKLGS